ESLVRALSGKWIVRSMNHFANASEFKNKIIANIDNIGLCLGLFLVVRIALSVWAVIVLNIYPYSIEFHWNASAFDLYSQVVEEVYNEDSQMHELTLWPWYRWDSEWYLRIAVDGYQPGGSAAFAPLYPAFIRVVGLVLGRRFLFAALLISNSAAFLSCILLYQETKNMFDAPTAARTILYLLAFPTAFFLVSAYSESLFIFFTLLAWRLAGKYRWGRSVVFASLAVLTRSQGIGLILPLVYMWWKSSPSRPSWGILFASMPLTFLGWALYARHVIGVEYPWQVLDQNWGLRLGWPWEGIINNGRLLFSGSFDGMVDPVSTFLDWVFAILFIVLIIRASKILSIEYALLMCVLILPALIKVSDGGMFVSISRYVLPLFPGFMILGHTGQNPYFHWGWVVVSFALQAMASAAFVLWVWVA
ncbi:MAG: hypothetical protein KKD28_01040, partial [Chloroflexi bacterium]|nr:hypothetical protein [Chloroflexota bacterium]